MKHAIHELVAGIAVLGALIVPAWAIVRERDTATTHEGTRIITLTGVKKDGAWTDEVVDGTTYWRKTFKSATLVLRQGEEVVLRLASADVRHGFYAPELGVGPVSIDPGHVVEVRIKPTQLGEFTYYCTEVCGHCHYNMKGIIRVVGPNDPIVPNASEKPCCNTAPAAAAVPPPATKTLVARGEFLFRDKGCFNCHGERGSGGVRNPNYLAGNVPQNNLIAEKMGLYEPEDAKLVIDLIEKRVDLTKVEPPESIRKWPQTVAQYKAIHDLILNGNRAGKKDPAGFQPPLSMPSWRYLLSDDDVDACIAYLISQYPWEEETE